MDVDGLETRKGELLEQFVHFVGVIVFVVLGVRVVSRTSSPSYVLFARAKRSERRDCVTNVQHIRDIDLKVEYS